MQGQGYLETLVEVTSLQPLYLLHFLLENLEQFNIKQLNYLFNGKQ